MLFNQSNLYRFEETSSYWSFYFFSAFHWSPSFGKSCVSGIFFVLSKLQNREVSLVTINQQTSYVSVILRQDDRIIKCLPMNYHLSSTFTEWMGRITVSDQTVWIVHSCISWFIFVYFTRFLFSLCNSKFDLHITHSYPETHKRVIGKHCRPTSDAT